MSPINPGYVLWGPCNFCDQCDGPEIKPGSGVFMCYECEEADDVEI